MAFDPTEPYSTAKGYTQSAYILLANPHRLQAPDDTTFYLAFHMLCGFAVELYLKAFLAHKGYSEDRLKKRDIGHDLIKLRELSVAAGLIDDGSKPLVDLLADQHKSFGFRYLKRSTIYRTVPLRDIFLAFSALDVAIDTAIGASASKGLSPNSGWVFPSDGPWRLPIEKT
jgi:hypothetical protein